MKKILILVIILVLVGSGIFLFFRSRGKSGGQAVLKVNSTPEATVFLDNQNIGKTPYENKVAAGEYTIKLIPESATTTFVSWEGKVKLSANLLTYVNRELGDSDINSAGETLTLEKASGNTAELAVLSNPDGAAVTLGTDQKGTTPLILKDVSPNNYDLAVSADGHKGRSVKIKLTTGYKLTADFQLAPSGEATVSATPGPSVSPGTTPKPSSTPLASSKPSTSPSSSSLTKTTPPPKPYITISDTPTGYLRVHQDASVDSAEVGRVNPGQQFALLDEQTSGGIAWYKIEYETNKEGWVSSQYATKVE